MASWDILLRSAIHEKQWINNNQHREITVVYYNNNNNNLKDAQFHNKLNSYVEGELTDDVTSDSGEWGIFTVQSRLEISLAVSEANLNYNCSLLLNFKLIFCCNY